jgi:RNA-directed DNA polymerase
MARLTYIDGLTGNSERWNAINWHIVFAIVRRIQARIVKAVKEEDKSRIRGLQRLLSRTRSAKLLAVRRVSSNQGSKTAGIDKVRLHTPASKWQKAGQLNQPDYKSKPLKRVYIPKKNGKQRPLGIPTQHDRCEQALEHMCIDPVAECRADHCSTGFRKKRSVQDAIEGCYNALRLKGSPKWIFEGDIKGCFDHINHEWMLNKTPTSSLSKLETWLKSGYMEKNVFYPSTDGTPQGGIISPTLANIALDGLEKLLKQSFKKKYKVHTVRYADDFIITGVSL